MSLLTFRIIAISYVVLGLIYEFSKRNLYIKLHRNIKINSLWKVSVWLIFMFIINPIAMLLWLPRLIGEIFTLVFLIKYDLMRRN
jgi:hypothetical protein